MEKLIKLFSQALIVITALLNLTACSTVGRVPIDIKQRKTIHHSNELLLTLQKHITVERSVPVYASYTPGVAGALGGAIGYSLIKTQLQSSANQVIMPVRKHIDKEPFNKLMNQQLAQELGTIKWLHLDKTGLKRFISYGEKKDLVNYSPNKGDAMIYVNLSYKFSQSIADSIFINTYNTLIVEADVEIYRKNDPKADLIYQNWFKYIDTIKPQREIKDYVALWAANDAARAKRSLRDAARLLSQAIAKDIQNPNIAPAPNRPTNIWFSESEPNQAISSGFLEEKIGDQYIIRKHSGEVVITNAPQIRTKHNWKE